MADLAARASGSALAWNTSGKLVMVSYNLYELITIASGIASGLPLGCIGDAAHRCWDHAALARVDDRAGRVRWLG
jgi:hypothetical protein